MANTVDKLIKIATEEVGYLEKKSNSQLYSKTANAGSGNYTKYAYEFDTKYPNFYNGKKNGYAYCDVFVDWCFVKAYGVEAAKKLLCQPDKSYGAGCGWSAEYYKRAGVFHASNPKIGDQIFFWNSGKTYAAHTGIVYKVDNTYVYTIEGNTSGASGVVDNGGGVYKKKYLLNYNRIYGYGRPKYDKEPVSSSSSSASATNRIDTVSEVQKFLNTTYKSGLTADNIYGKNTKKAIIKAIQKELGFTGKNVDGIWGEKTAGAIKVLKRGSKGALVKLLQCLLVCNGYKKAYVDGDYGIATEDAVEDVQRKNGLSVDGEAGKNTFAKLCG